MEVGPALTDIVDFAELEQEEQGVGRTLSDVTIPDLPALPGSNSRDSMDTNIELLPKPQAARPQPQLKPQQQQSRLQEHEEEQQEQQEQQEQEEHEPHHPRPLRERAGSGVSSSGRVRPRSRQTRPIPAGPNSHVERISHVERARQRRQKGIVAPEPEEAAQELGGTASQGQQRGARAPRRRHVSSRARTGSELWQPSAEDEMMPAQSSPMEEQVAGSPRQEVQQAGSSAEALGTVGRHTQQQQQDGMEEVAAGKVLSLSRSTLTTHPIEVVDSSMTEEMQADWLICSLYSRKNPSKLQEVESRLEKCGLSDKFALYKQACAKYGEVPQVFGREKREMRAVELICDLYMRRNPMKYNDMDKILKQCKGSKEKFYQRICEKYGETPVDLTAKQRDEALSSGSSTASTRAPSLSRSSSGKECTRCHMSYTGFGEVCFRCRKKGSQGSAQQCQQCGEYFQGFGTACHECRELGEELMG